MEIKEINEKLTDYLELKKQADSIKEKLDYMKALLKLDLEANNIKYYKDSIGNDIKFDTRKRKGISKPLVEVMCVEKGIDIQTLMKESEFDVISIRSVEKIKAQKGFKS